MNLYTDDNPNTTIKGLGFKNKQKALETIQIVENYFNKINKMQDLPGFTPDNLLPKIYLTNIQQKNNYYKKQKMYRILAMNNRAKGMLPNINNKNKIKDFMKAIKCFDKWLKNYKKYK